MNLLDMRGAWGSATSLSWDLVVAPVLLEVYEERWAAAARPDPIGPGMRVLDVGCGTGRFVASLARRHPRTTFMGVDLSEVMLDRAWRLHGALPNLRFERGDAMGLTLPDATCDVVLSFASIKHWPDPGRGVAEIFRVLAPGGRVVVLEADRDATRSVAERFVARFRWAPALLRRIITEYFVRVVIAQGITAAALERHLVTAGFEAVAVARQADLPGVIGQGRRPRTTEPF
jgi:ubiquinone/menaquinone biosynthesis C-methylase UbiE